MTALDTTEKRFEQDIETFLLSKKGGYVKLEHTAFDKQKGLFFDTLISFIKSTQEKQWKRYETIYGDNAEKAFYGRFNECVNQSGLIHVLRNGFEDRGIKFSVCYFLPTSTLNPELVENYNSNILGVTRQFYYSTQNNNSIDMVLSINGIPVVALELKNQLKGQNIENSKLQFQYDRDPKEMCFNFNKRFLVYFAVDLYDAYMTTELKAANTYFLPFNQGSNGAGNVGGAGNPENPNGYATSYLWERVLQADNLMLLLQRYISVQIEEKTEIKNGTKTKTKTKRIIFPRYHQFDVVEKVVADVVRKGSGKNYLIQHSAGSGKSNSIAWLTYKLAGLYDKNNEVIFNSVIIVTDRRVLDKQLQATISGFDHKAGLVELIDDKKTSQDLKQAINDGKKIIITTLQKFPIIFDQVNDTKGRRFAIIVDEAHSSQTGNSAKKLKTALADKTEALKEYAEISDEEVDGEDEINNQMLAQGKHKNLSFFAFTATPKPKTLNIFAERQADGSFAPFHIYSMRQAIDEEFILDVLKNYTTVEQYFKIARATEENKEYKETPAIKAILKYYKNHQKVINDLVEVVVEQFRAVTLTKIGGKAKAMVVCPSREYAVRFYNAVQKYVAKKSYDEVRVLVAFSSDLEVDGIKYEETRLNKTIDGKRISESALPEYFAGDEFNTLIVADKYQTGFDEPKLHTMFILKALSGVKAVQTLSRVNRICKGKVDTFIMDFVNSAVSIQNSFQPFYENTLLESDFKINNVYDILTTIKEFHLFNDDDIEKFVKIYNKREQTERDLGAITSLFKPIIQRFNDLLVEQRAEYKDHIKSFNRFYSYITQIVRLFDKELHKSYLFAEYLYKLLPRKASEKVNLDDKIKLEFASLKETFSGSIELKKTPENDNNVLKPTGDKVAKVKSEKIDLLQNIIDKINIMFEGKFEETDRVIVETIYNRIIGSDNKQLKRQAKTNTAEMFTDSIFPKTFTDTAEDCYHQQAEAFSKLFQNKDFFDKVMKAMGAALYKSLRQ